MYYVTIIDTNCTREDFTRHVLQMNSAGKEKLYYTILQACSPYITSPLNYICNRALFTGIFPDRIKFSTVRPLLKKVIKETYPITNQYHYYQYFQKFWRE